LARRRLDAGQKLLDQTVDASPALPVVGGAPRYEVGAQLSEEFGALAYFFADPVPDATEIPKADTVHGQ
jgi:hypothetical protein